MSYSPVRISTIKPQKLLPFNLYIFFRDTYICYKETGKTVEDELLLKLKKQRVAKFHIQADAEVLYQEYLDEVLAETMDDPNVATESKVDMAEGATATAVEKMQDDPNSKVAFKMTEKAATTLVSLVQNNPDALKMIFDRKTDEKDEKIIKHSLNVSALSTKLAAKFNLKENEIESIAVAALVQYIALPRLGDIKELFFKRREDLTPDEKLKYLTNAKESAMLLQDKEYITAEIINLVMNSEENLQGTGANKKSKLTSSEEILCLVNRYDHRVTVGELSPKDAFKEVQIDELGNFALESINILKKVLKEEGLM